MLNAWIILWYINLEDINRFEVKWPGSKDLWLKKKYCKSKKKVTEKERKRKYEKPQKSMIGITDITE